MTTASAHPQTASRPKRIFNFSAGPAILPEEVILQAQQDLWSIFDSGIGIMEHSHRGKVFDRVREEAEADCRTLAGISDEYAVLFLQGGATMQFAMIPMNFLASEQTADYPNTGVWTAKAIKEAKLFGGVNVAFDGETCGFDHTPEAHELSQTPGAAYLHYCSNNTIYGTQYPAPPETAAPLVCDASSDIFSRPIDVDRHAIIYAGAQKNLGPSGVTLVIIRRDMLDRARTGLPSMLDYRSHAENDSCYNTPPTFGIYTMGRVFKWILTNGGLNAMAERNTAKAALIYEAIDTSSGFYTGVSQPQCRSTMNITFRCPNEALDKAFLSEAARQDMDGLKGHRSTGGIRASIYNAFPHRGCEALAEFMREFARTNG